MSRRNPNLSEKLAAALLAIRQSDGSWLIPEPTRSTGGPDDILRIVEWDHFPIPVAIGGDNRPQNLVPRRIADHRTKTTTIDIPAIAKSRRISVEQEAFRLRLLQKSGQAEPTETPRATLRGRFRRLPPGHRYDWASRRVVRATGKGAVK